MPFDLSTAKPVGGGGFDLSTAKPVQGAQDQPPPAAAAPQPSLADQFVRGQGLGARNTIEGAASVLTVPSDMLGSLLDAALEKAGVSFRFGSSSQALHDLLTKAGLPEPQTEGEQTAAKFGRAISAVPGYVATGGAMAGAASPVVAGVGETLAANPVLQTASAVTGTAGSEVARKMGGGPIAQTVGGLVGAAVPGVVSSLAPAAVRGAFRGGEQGRQTVEDNIDTFAKAGTTPTVGQATEGRVNRAIESGLSRVPGSAGRMSSVAQNQADDVAAEIETQAQKLAGRSTSAEQTGRAIEQQVRGDGGFVDQFKQKQQALYDKLDQFVPAAAKVDVSNTKVALANLNADIPGAENVSKFFQNAKIKGIEGALEKDTASGAGTLPYEALKKLRTLVGNEMADSSIASDVPRSKWKALYAALSGDMETAVAGNAPAEAAWSRANNYTRAGMARIDAIQGVLDRNGGPEAIFKAATSGTQEGASTLRAVMQSVGEDGQKMITATVLRRLGLAKAGVQGELGDKFSTESFLTNWNKLSPEAKRTLFNRYGDNFRSNMDSVSSLASNLREGSAVFRNPSGTAQATALTGMAATVGGAVVSMLSGNAAAGATALGAVGGLAGGANLTARLMTNPRFVKWLAQSTKVPIGSYTAMVNRLGQQARDTKDIDLARAAVALQQSPDNEGDQPQKQQGAQ